MTQEEKQLLLKDLCARLPYGVKVKYYSMEYPYGSDPITLTSYLLWNRWENINGMRPYLRPMSSMTVEEAFNYKHLDLLNYSNDGFEMPNFRSIDWLLSHHFDFRGLIERGLALEATEGMYKTEQNMFPWWFILLIILGILLGIYFFYYAIYKCEDDIDTSACVVLGSVSLGFALLPLVAIIFG